MRKQGSEKVSHTTLKLLDTFSTLVRKEALTRYRRSCGYCAQSIHKELHNILLFMYPLVAPHYDLTVLLPSLATTDLITDSGCLMLSLPLEALRTDNPDNDNILPVPSASTEKHLRADSGQDGGH